MSMPDYTPDQIMHAIAGAISDHDFPATVSLLRMLAVKDPVSAQKIYDAVLMEAGRENDSHDH